MDTITAYTVEGSNQFTFDPIVKNNSIKFLYFVPTKGSPEKFKMIVSLYKKDNILIEEHPFILEMDDSGKKYNEHNIGVLQNGLTQKLIFTALNFQNDTPLEKICISVAIAKKR